MMMMLPATTRRRQQPATSVVVATWGSPSTALLLSSWTDVAVEDTTAPYFRQPPRPCPLLRTRLLRPRIDDAATTYSCLGRRPPTGRPGPARRLEEEEWPPAQPAGGSFFYPPSPRGQSFICH